MNELGPHHQDRWRRRVLRWTRRVAVGGAVAVGAFLLGVGVVTRTFPDLERPQTIRLHGELRAGQAGAPHDLQEYMALEDRLFAELHSKVYRTVPGPSQVFDRYVTGSPSDPDRGKVNWNRTRVVVPEGHRGAVLLLHGLSDSPYSLRSIGNLYLRHGFAVIWLRLPGHGTVPSALTRIRWKDWVAATGLGLARATELAGGGPLHVVGYSNGGLLALDATLRRLDGHNAGRVPSRVVLLSPSIGILPIARFARWIKLISWLPPFRKAQWQEVHQEIDPHKYSSFPFNASYQCWVGTRTVHRLLSRLRARNGLRGMPPVLAFQSVTDATVVATAVKDRCFDLLPANGSELVLFDVNRSRTLRRFFSPKVRTLAPWQLDQTGRTYTIDLVTNRSPDTAEVVERIQRPGEPPAVRETGLSWPPHLYSLSHVALPFPADDPIYGDGTAPDADRTLPLGSLDLKGETGQLQIPQSLLYRVRYNPFFDVIRRHIESTLTDGETRPAGGGRT